MFDPECSPLTATWDAFSVIMGILVYMASISLFLTGLLLLGMLRMTELDKGPLSQNSLELLQICLLTSELSKSCIDTLFTKLYDYIFAGLGIEETSQTSWDVILIFMLKASTSHILKVFAVYYG